MTDTSSIAALAAPGTQDTDISLMSLNPLSSRNTQNVDTVSKDFEAVFITQMLKEMFSGDEMDAYFGSGTAGDVYKGYLLDAYGKSIANAGGIGIAAPVKQELLKLQEAHA